MTKLVIILIISRYFVILNVFWHKLMETDALLFTSNCPAANADKT